MSKKHVVILVFFVGIYLILTNTYSMIDKRGNILDYAGISLGFIHLIFGSVFMKKIRKENTDNNR